MSLRSFALACVLGVLGASEALACPDPGEGLAEGPAGANWVDGALGDAHRVCPRSEVGVGGNLTLLADAPNFYGHIGAMLVLDGSVAIGRKAEIFGRAELARYDSVLGAVSSDRFGPGHLSLGASGLVWTTAKSGLSVHGQVVLPTAFGLYRNAWPLAADVGVTGSFGLDRRLNLLAGAGFLGSFAVSGGPSQPRGGFTLLGGAEVRPVKVFAFEVDANALFGYGPEAVESLSVNASFRFRTGWNHGLALDVRVPVAGRYPPLASAQLRWAMRFGAVRLKKDG